MNVNYCFTKQCPKCKENCDLMDFALDNTRTKKLQIYCRTCQHEKSKKSYFGNHNENLKKKRKQRLKKYGITQETYDKMLTEQNNCCKICGRNQTEVKQRFCVDHNHKTGIVRSLLCHRCNSAIGLLYDDVDIIKIAVKYLTEKE